MLTFKSITARDTAMLRRYYENCNYELCEYSAGVKFMWRSVLHYTWAEVAGCLAIRCESEGHVSFDYPVAVRRGTRMPRSPPSRPIALKRAFCGDIHRAGRESAPAAGPVSLCAGEQYPHLAGIICTTRRIYSSLPGDGIPASGTISRNSGSNGRRRSSVPSAPRRMLRPSGSFGQTLKRNSPRTAAARRWRSWPWPRR